MDSLLVSDRRARELPYHQVAKHCSKPCTRTKLGMAILSQICSKLCRLARETGKTSPSQHEPYGQNTLIHDRTDNLRLAGSGFFPVSQFSDCRRQLPHCAMEGRVGTEGVKEQIAMANRPDRRPAR